MEKEYKKRKCPIRCSGSTRITRWRRKVWRPYPRRFRPKRNESQIIRPKKLAIQIPISVKDLAQGMKLKASELISKLFLQGVIVTINDYLEDENNGSSSWS